MNPQIVNDNSLFQRIFLLSLILASFVLMYLFSDIVLILGISILLSLLFDPAVKFFERKGLGRLPSTAAVFGLVSFLFYFAFSVFIPNIVNQINSLGLMLKDISLQDKIVAAETFLSKIFFFLPQGIISKQLEHFFTSSIESAFFQFTTAIPNIFSVLIFTVLIPFTTFFIVKDHTKLIKGILNLLPNKYFEMSYWIIKKITQQLGRYVRGWILDAAFVGFACGLSFYVIGVDNATALGIIAGIGHLIPYFGPLIGGIPAIALSIIQNGDLSSVPFILFALMGIYIVDNGVIQPYVFSKSVDMHPLIIILLIVAGSQLFGILGMLLAVPTATVIRTAATEIYFALKNYKIARL
jgi:predicted PurR-regulated permease PerM